LLVGQRTEILASFGAATGGVGGGSAIMATIVIFYRRKKMGREALDPLNLKLQRSQQSPATPQGSSGTSFMYNSNPQNPLFQASDLI